MARLASSPCRRAMIAQRHDTVEIPDATDFGRCCCFCHIFRFTDRAGSRHSACLPQAHEYRPRPRGGTDFTQSCFGVSDFSARTSAIGMLRLFTAISPISMPALLILRRLTRASIATPIRVRFNTIRPRHADIAKRRFRRALDVISTMHFGMLPTLHRFRLMPFTNDASPTPPVSIMRYRGTLHRYNLLAHTSMLSVVDDDFGAARMPRRCLYRFISTQSKMGTAARVILTAR